MRVVPIAILLVCGSFVAGCGKKPTPASEPAPQRESSTSVDKLLGDKTAAPAAPAPGAPNAEPTENASAATKVDPAGQDDALKTLNAAIDYYVLRENRPPKTMQDLLEGGNLKAVPPAPPGMKYVIDVSKLKAKLVKK